MEAQPYGKHSHCLGLTGGIACGKSAVAHILEHRHGLVRVDADRVARDVVAVGSLGLAQVVERFGPSLCESDGSLNRSALGKVVFADDSARADLEAILHPLIWERLKVEMERAQMKFRETVFELPLLYENRREGIFGTVWVVAAHPEVQRRRIVHRDGLSEPEADARIRSQMSLDDKVEKADFVILNNGDPEALADQITQGLDLWRRARSEAR